jgi:CRP/FNR family transcriptional regulator, anaerobic regulatory protein
MHERLIDYLIEKSEDGKLQVTHQVIANELGTAREVVSRLLKELERRGSVRLARNSIQLVNLYHTWFFLPKLHFHLWSSSFGDKVTIFG